MNNGTQKREKTLEESTILEQVKPVENVVEQALTTLERKVDLEGSARDSGAMVRHRVIKTALNLLKMVMVYALADFSLPMVGLWATVMEWGSIGKSAVYKRLCQCGPWIGALIVLVLQTSQVKLLKKTGYQVEAIDASNVSYPGSNKADWRLHLRFDLTRMSISGVELTDNKRGETLTRWQFSPNMIILADRAYGVAKSLGVLFAAVACFVIRIGWQNLPLTGKKGQPFAICEWLRKLSSDPNADPAEVEAWVKTPAGRFPLRLVARAIPPDKAEKLRNNLRAEAKRKKRQIQENTLLAAGFVMVVSNLPTEIWSAWEILALYRLRWQVELVFKRLKGLLLFDHLRATTPPLAQVYLLTKILVALLLTEAQWSLALAAADNPPDLEQSISHWRLFQLLLEGFRNSVCGTLTLDLIQRNFPRLLRYLCDEPRRRQRQIVSLLNLEAIHAV